MSYPVLKEQHRTLREDFDQSLSLRTHRALSWLQRAELSDDDLDIQFISLWVSFNAAYAVDVDAQYRTSERGIFESFFAKLVKLDTEHRLYQLVWQEFSGPIRLLLNNEHTFQPFWDFQNGSINERRWREDFMRSKRRATEGLVSKDTDRVLSIVFRRIYTLRNQVLHGGATWNSSANRTQLQDCTAILLKVVPVVIELMMQHPEENWGEAHYPVVD
ncbi:MAG: hypothetical protein ACPGMR_05350 [Pontibacterium sp.]